MGLISGNWSRNNLSRMFIELCNLNSINNENAARMYFYAFMGLYFRDTTIDIGYTKKDLRVNVMWIQPTRTGKSQLNKIFKKICSEFDIKVVTLTEYTTAGLIGSIDTDAIKHNKKYQLSENLPSRMVGKVLQEYQDPVVKGDLANYDILIFDEAKLLLLPSHHTQNLLSVLQPVLDYPGYVRKKLSSEVAIEYECNPTMIATTYPFERMSGVLMEQGFFQRLALFSKNFTTEEIFSRLKQARKTLSGQPTEKLYNEMITIFKNKMKNLKKYKEVTLSNGSIKRMDEFEEILKEKIISTLKGKHKTAAATFGATMMDYTLKIAALQALMEGRNKILDRDVNLAYSRTTRFILDTTLYSLDVTESKDMKKERATILHLHGVLKREKKDVKKVDLRNFLADRLNIGNNMAAKKIQNLVEENYFHEVKGKGNTKYVEKK